MEENFSWCDNESLINKLYDTFRCLTQMLEATKSKLPKKFNDAAPLQMIRETKPVIKILGMAAEIWKVMKALHESMKQGKRDVNICFVFVISTLDMIYRVYTEMV